MLAAHNNTGTHINASGLASTSRGIITYQAVLYTPRAGDRERQITTDDSRSKELHSPVSIKVTVVQQMYAGHENVHPRNTRLAREKNLPPCLLLRESGCLNSSKYTTTNVREKVIQSMLKATINLSGLDDIL
jgi:hypothetical protein